MNPLPQTGTCHPHPRLNGGIVIGTAVFASENEPQRVFPICLPRTIKLLRPEDPDLEPATLRRMESEVTFENLCSIYIF